MILGPLPSRVTGFSVMFFEQSIQGNFVATFAKLKNILEIYCKILGTKLKGAKPFLFHFRFQLDSKKFSDQLC
jgi:hypothetical protein